LETVDRGGLLHVNDPTFMFFRALEIRTQKVLPKHLAINQNSKEDLIKAVIDDEDVGFTWDMLTTDISSPDHVHELLACVTDLWVTIRGFSLAASWLEEYKLASSKETQKTKSLRKGLKQKDVK
jgi:hypothetical protein